MDSNDAYSYKAEQNIIRIEQLGFDIGIIGDNGQNAIYKLEIN